MLSWGIVPIVYLFVPRRKINTTKFRLLLFASYSFLMEYFCSNEDLLNDFLQGTNFPAYHVGTIILILLLGWIFSDHLKELLPPAFLILAAGAAVLFGVWNAVWGEGIMAFPNASIILYSLLGILLPISYLLVLLRTLAVERLEENTLFVAAVGLLIYYSGNFLMWLFFTFYLDNYEIYQSISRVSHVLTIIVVLFITSAILITPGTVKPQPVNA